MASKSGMWQVSICPFCFRTPFREDPFRSCAFCFSVCEFLCVMILMIYKAFIFLLPSIFSDSYSPPTMPFAGFLKPEWRDLIETTYLELSIPRSFILCLMSRCLDVCICSHLQQKEPFMMMTE